MNRLMRYFDYEHLPERLAEVSAPFCALAREMDHRFDESAEKTAGLRKLPEAKDCFVRAAIDDEGGQDV